MALEFTNQNASVPNPPEQIVYFQVKVNRDNCDNIAAKTEVLLKHLETNGFEVSLLELIGTAGAHFSDGAVDFSGHGIAAAEIQRAWDSLAHSQPKAVYNKKLGKNRLVVTKSKNNPRMDSLAAEILAVGVGLPLAIRFYDIPLQSWFPTGLATTDFAAYDSNRNLVKLEVRGRFA